jgi:aspartate aminotransferase
MTLTANSLDHVIAEMAETLIGSEIIKQANEVNEKIKNGQPIYNLTIGDFDPKVFPIPTALLDEIILAYQDGHTNYPMANGMPDLRKAVSHFLKVKQRLDYSTDEILISGGSRPLIYAVYKTLIDPGDKVVFRFHHGTTIIIVTCRKLKQLWLKQLPKLILCLLPAS